MLKKLNFTFPYLDAKVPVSKEWKIIIVSSKSHTNTRCDGRRGGKKETQLHMKQLQEFIQLGNMSCWPRALQVHKPLWSRRFVKAGEMKHQEFWNYVCAGHSESLLP